MLDLWQNKFWTFYYNLWSYKKLSVPCVQVVPACANQASHSANSGSILYQTGILMMCELFRTVPFLLPFYTSAPSKSSVSDLDPHGSAQRYASWIRIWIHMDRCRSGSWSRRWIQNWKHKSKDPFDFCNTLCFLFFNGVLMSFWKIKSNIFLYKYFRDPGSG